MGKLKDWIKRKTASPFQDAIPVHTSSLGTQYVLPEDILAHHFFVEQRKEINRFLDALREDRRRRGKG